MRNLQAEKATLTCLSHEYTLVLCNKKNSSCCQNMSKVPSENSNVHYLFTCLFRKNVQPQLLQPQIIQLKRNVWPIVPLCCENVSRVSLDRSNMHYFTHWFKKKRKEKRSVSPIVQITKKVSREEAPATKMQNVLTMLRQSGNPDQKWCSRYLQKTQNIARRAHFLVSNSNGSHLETRHYICDAKWIRRSLFLIKQLRLNQRHIYF